MLAWLLACLLVCALGSRPPVGCRPSISLLNYRISLLYYMTSLMYYNIHRVEEAAGEGYGPIEVDCHATIRVSIIAESRLPRPAHSPQRRRVISHPRPPRLRPLGPGAPRPGHHLLRRLLGHRPPQKSPRPKLGSGWHGRGKATISKPQILFLTQKPSGIPDLDLDPRLRTNTATFKFRAQGQCPSSLGLRVSDLQV